MHDVDYLRPGTAREAVAMAAATPGARYFAGGTTLYDLMKLGVEAPRTVIDVTAIQDLRTVTRTAGGEIGIGALVTMSEAAGHPALAGKFPVLSEALSKAASQQLRNMATIGGNLLQRTRCAYFRGGAEFPCNKRNPGSGCAAIGGLDRSHALFGASAACIAVNPGDLPVALTAFDAVVDVLGPHGARSIPIHALYLPPGTTPHREHALTPQELIVRIRVPHAQAARASTYHKIRDRESYAFALVSAAVGVHLQRGKVADARIALGGVATTPWRGRAAEQFLAGGALTRQRAQQAATLCFADARPLQHNRFKIALGVATVADALMLAKEKA